MLSSGDATASRRRRSGHVASATPIDERAVRGRRGGASDGPARRSTRRRRSRSTCSAASAAPWSKRVVADRDRASSRSLTLRALPQAPEAPAARPPVQLVTPRPDPTAWQSRPVLEPVFDAATLAPADARPDGPCWASTPVCRAVGTARCAGERRHLRGGRLRRDPHRRRPTRCRSGWPTLAARARGRSSTSSARRRWPSSGCCSR